MAPRRPQILPVQPGCERDALKRAVEVLEAGGLVVLPTDTVYGVAAHPAVTGAQERLFSVKGRDRSKPVPLLADGVEGVVRYGARLGPKERRLAERFWPGPLTLVLEVGFGREGFRVPDHPFAMALLKAVGGVLRVTSANLSGDPPALTATEAVRALGGVVELVLDGGPVRLGQPSTVAKIENGDLCIIREGALTRQELANALE